jgi:DNA-binding MarR family transcriptional regulator
METIFEIQAGQCAGIGELYRRIENISRKLQRIKQETAKKMNLTPPQFYILKLLWDEDGLPFKEVSRRHGTSRAAITGFIDAMEKKGLVYRDSNRQDRRSLLVRLTAKGKSLQSSSFDLDTLYGECCKGLEPDEYRQLAILLEKLEYSLNFPDGS